MAGLAVQYYLKHKRLATHVGKNLKISSNTVTADMK